MGKQYTYELYAKDHISGALTKIKGVSQDTYDKLTNSQKKYNEEVKTGGTLLKTIGGLFTAYLGAQTLQNIVQLGANMEQTRVAFSTFLGSAEKANTVLAGLTEFAKVTPFNKEEVIQSGRALLAANIPAEKLQATLRAIGDVASGTKTPLNDMASIYAKAMNKGRIQGEELNQLGERGVPILNEFAKMFGVTREEVLKLGEKGLITSDIVTEAFMRMSGKGGMFYNLMEKQSGTLAGKISNLQDTFMEWGTSIGEGITPALKSLIDGLMSLFGWIGRNKDYLMLAVVAVSAATVAYGAFYLVVNRMMILKKITTAIHAFNLALAANPIGVTVMVIAALIAALVYAWYKFDKFRGFLFGFWEAFKQVFIGIKDLAIGVFKGLGLLIAGAITFNPSKIGEGISMLGGSFSNYGKQIADKFSAGFDEGVAFKPKVPDFLKGMVGDTATAATAGVASGLGGDGNIQAGLAGITSGGSKPTNITINLGKFQDQIVIHANGIKEGIDEMQELVETSLLKILNSANKLATQ